MISSHRGGKQKKRNLEQCNRPCPIDVTLLLVTVPPHPSIVFGGRYSHSDATEQKERGHRSTGRRFRLVCWVGQLRVGEYRRLKHE